MGRIGKAKEVAKETSTSSKKAAKAAHQQRTDSGAREGRASKPIESTPDWAPKTTESGVPTVPKRAR